MQINVRKGSGTLPQKSPERPKKKGKEAPKKSGASSQESREERRAKRLQDLQRSRENIAQQEQELSLNPPPEEPVSTGGIDGTDATVPVSMTVPEESPAEVPVEDSEELSLDPSPELEGSTVGDPLAEEWPKADSSAEAAAEAEVLAAQELAAEAGTPPEKTEVQNHTPAAPKGHAGLSLGPAKSKRGKMEPAENTEPAVAESVPQKKSKVKSGKSGAFQAGRKKPASAEKKKSQKRREVPAEMDSLDLVYSGTKLKGGNSLSLVFILGMILATAVSAGAGFIFSDVIQTLLIPLGV